MLKMFKRFLVVYFIVICILSSCAQIETPPPPAGCPLPVQTKVAETASKEEEGFIQVNGGKIWYRISGIGKTGIPLIVLQGGPWATHEHLENMENLSGDRPVIFFDQLGSGRSERPDDKSLWRLERYVLELKELREGLKLPKVHILTQSFGSMVALDYALLEPENVASLVLSGPVLSARRFAADAQSWVDQLPAKQKRTIDKAWNSGEFKSEEYQNVVRLYRNKHLCRLNPWPDSLNRMIQNVNMPLYEYMWGPSDFHSKGVLKDYERISELGRIQMPVFLSCGEFDEVPPRTCAFYSKLFPKVEVLAFGEASHQHHLEKEASYFLALKRFLKKADKISYYKCPKS